jgi:hypothetical protein
MLQHLIFPYQFSIQILITKQKDLLITDSKKDIKVKEFYQQLE